MIEQESTTQNSSALFIPSPNDNVTNIAGREKIPVYFFVDVNEPSVIYARTCGKAEIKDNSSYTINMPELQFKDGQVVSNLKEEFITAPSPAYVSIADVSTLCKGLPISKPNIAYYIKESSKIADYWAFRESEKSQGSTDIIFSKENIKEDYYPFYMFVKYRSVVECIKEFYISAVSNPSEYHDVLSDLERKEKMDLAAIKKLLDSLTEEADNWLELVITITADPKWALRGKYSFAVTNYNYRPYHPTGIDRTDWSRGY